MSNVKAPKLQDQSLYITKAYLNGEWVDSVSGETFEVVNPSTGDVIAIIPEMVSFPNGCFGR